MQTQAPTPSGSVPVKDGQGVRTALGTWVRASCRALEAAGCDMAALLAEAGLDLRYLDGPNARAPLTHTERLWKLAVAATGDPAFGIKVASHIKQRTFHALSYGLSASSTLIDAFERAQRCCDVERRALADKVCR